MAIYSEFSYQKKSQLSIAMSNYQRVLKTAIEIVDFPIETGGSFQKKPCKKGSTGGCSTGIFAALSLQEDYPVVNGGSDDRSELGVFIFPKKIPCFMGSRLELPRVSQPSTRNLRFFFLKMLIPNRTCFNTFCS